MSGVLTKKDHLDRRCREGWRQDLVAYLYHQGLLGAVETSRKMTEPSLPLRGPKPLDALNIDF